MRDEKMKCTVKVPAKINLSLDVVGKRADGYHLLETIMQSIDLHDVIRVSLVDPPVSTPGNIRIIADNPTFPCDSRNTCHKAAERFFHALGNIGNETSDRIEKKQILIHITKHIPQAAGLAGGSADASAVLIALNNLCGFPFSGEELSRIGVKVGADVPFCLTGGTVLCTGIGEILEPLSVLQDVPIVLIKPDFGVSTPWVFDRLDIGNLGKRPDTLRVIQAIREQDIPTLFAETANVLESVTLPAYPILARIKEVLLDCGGIGSLMSGSGPSVFGIFQTEEHAEAAVAKIEKISGFASYTILKTKTTPNGPVCLDDMDKAW